MKMLMAPQGRLVLEESITIWSLALEGMLIGCLGHVDDAGVISNLAIFLE